MRGAVLFVLVCAALMLSSCGDDLDDSQRSTEAGPLAFVPDPQGSETALTAGTMRIDDRCVSLVDTEGESVTLVWPDGRTTWIDDEQSVEYTDISGETVVLHDGDRVEMGGGGESAAEGEGANGEWLARINWVSPPDEACVFGTRWFVGEVDVLP